MRVALPELRSVVERLAAEGRVEDGYRVRLPQPLDVVVETRWFGRSLKLVLPTTLEAFLAEDGVGVGLVLWASEGEAIYVLVLTLLRDGRALYHCICRDDNAISWSEGLVVEPRRFEEIDLGEELAEVLVDEVAGHVLEDLGWPAELRGRLLRIAAEKLSALPGAEVVESDVLRDAIRSAVDALESALREA